MIPTTRNSDDHDEPKETLNSVSEAAAEISYRATTENQPDERNADSELGSLLRDQLEKPSPRDGKEITDPFDLESLRLSQDFASDLSVKKALLSVPVRKPGRTWFVRVHPDESYRLQTAVLELKEEQETYLVAPQLWSQLSTEPAFSPRALFTATNRQGVLFVWPVPLPGPDGRTNKWHETHLEAATMAMEGWVRVTANMNLGAYEVFQASGDIPEPAWPEESLQDLLRIALKERLIDSSDHPVLRRLRGEV